ncbi:FtsW/RodA/SpoVE family cell cycle protein [Aeribacillus sp. FSL K6-1121]|uniref:FtsW/RodA/SpoVE family cell cycle protein n=1 Tax=Aeribacillus TaxID=1055323 RepID=UPI000E36EA72|nr:FtsW/RodA/SpoVE family cell cycle protein [Aeribacillus composti]MED1440596.1 FtsW/RodA/SpoVE family cell cycle protein [Aeribacillus composti]MED4486667.1 FtsW/RodA/SpoVE family cell cycle protein [Aeribacillus pallidus]REJ25088.1 MAG: cell division protein FtsW [Bacillaceae bacterium]
MLKRILKSYDYSLILAVFLLCGFGLVMVYSSSMIMAVTRYYTESDYFFRKQLSSLLLATIAFLVMMFFPYRALLNGKFIRILFFGSIAVLGLLFIFGHVAGGSQSWFKVAGRAIQPGEFVKLSAIIYLSAVYEKKQSYIWHFGKGALPPVIFTVLICVFVMLQPDIGTSFIIGMIALSIILCSGMGIKNMLKLVLLALFFLLLLSPLILFKADDIFSKERLSRFTGYTDPFEHEDGAGYQLVNSYIAIGSGGLTGLGLGESVQKYGYLPEAHTDFIMAVVAEELGIFGVLFVLALLAFIVLKGLYIARKCTDPFGTLIAVGVSSMIAIQTAVNLGGVTGLIPITGVTLPFVSYGGSSLLVLLISMGLLVNVSMFVNYREQYKKEKEITSM